MDDNGVIVPAGQVSERGHRIRDVPQRGEQARVLAQVPARLERPRHRQPQPRETQQLPEQRDIAARLSTTRPSQEAPGEAGLWILRQAQGQRAEPNLEQ